MRCDETWLGEVVKGVKYMITINVHGHIAEMRQGNTCALCRYTPDGT
jgi:hypothetical protein